MLLIAIAILFATRCNDLQRGAERLQPVAKSLQQRFLETAKVKALLQRGAKYIATLANALQSNNNKQVASIKKTDCNDEFADSLQCVATRLQVPATWLQNTMQAESGLQPDAVNSIGATGLIQFLPTTAIDLGTTTAQLAKMSAVEQLVYVEKFYTPVRGKIKSETDLRLFTFFPAALNKPDTFIMQTDLLPANVVASRNPHFDLNADMKITVGEFKTVLR